MGLSYFINRMISSQDHLKKGDANIQKKLELCQDQ
jgi:hypothetical protein